MSRTPLADIERGLYAALAKVDTPEFQQLLRELAAESPAYLAAHLAAEHTVPSPSSLQMCRLQLWLKAKGYERENEVPAYWTMRAVTGTLMEPFYKALLIMAGEDVSLVPTSIKCGDYMGGIPDAYIGDEGIGEFKNKNGWEYKRLLEGEGLAYEIPREYVQIQQYLGGADRDWCLYLATPDSPGMLQSSMSSYKRYKAIEGWKLPLFYLEYIDRNDKDVLIGLKRAEMLVADQQSDTPPPREYDGQIHEKGRHPCNICPFRKECNAITDAKRHSD